MHKEKTFVAIKPEGIQRRLIGEIIARFEKKGLKLIAAKFACPTRELIEQHYLADEEWLESSGNKTYENYKSKGIDPKTTPRELALRTHKRCVDHLADRTLMAMVWEGPHAVEISRKIAGFTNPLVAETGSIRGDFSSESYEMADGYDRSILNMIHASGSPEEANREIDLWFDKSEIIDYDMVDSELILGKDWGRIKNRS